MWKLCLGVSVIIEILLMCCNFKQWKFKKNIVLIIIKVVNSLSMDLRSFNWVSINLLSKN
jgi:hypothetical protein